MNRALSEAAADEEKHAHTEARRLRRKHGPIRTITSHANQQQDHGAKICVGARRPDGHHKPQHDGNEKIPDLEFDCTFGTDRPRDPERQVTIMAATDSVNTSYVGLMAQRREREMLNYVDVEWKFDQEPQTLKLAHVQTKKCKMTVSAKSVTPGGSYGCVAEEQDPSQRREDNVERYEHKECQLQGLMDESVSKKE